LGSAFLLDGQRLLQVTARLLPLSEVPQQHPQVVQAAGQVRVVGGSAFFKMASACSQQARASSSFPRSYSSVPRLFRLVAREGWSLGSAFVLMASASSR